MKKASIIGRGGSSIQLGKLMIVLASSGFGTVLIGIIIVILDSGSSMGRIVIVSGVVILLAASVVTRRLRKKIQRKLKRK